MTLLQPFKKLLFFCFSLFTLLTGCTGLNSSFTCPTQPGVMCSSLDQVNTMIDQGKIGATPSAVIQSKIAATQNQPTLNPVTISNPELLRNPETVMRMWIAPYQDEQGNYYQPGMIYSVVKSSHWINNPSQLLKGLLTSGLPSNVLLLKI